MTAAEAKNTSGTPAQRYFIAGLLTVIPLGVTVFVLYYLVKFLGAIGKYPVFLMTKSLREADRAEWQSSLIEFLDKSPWVYDTLGFILVLLLIYFVGIMTSNFIGKQLVRLFEWFVNGIPLVKTIYGAVKKLVDMVSQDPGGGDVQRVVLIEFPSPEMKTIGLVTRTFQDAHTGRKLAAVYVPTTPNPTSGYLEIVPVDRIVSTDWTFDQAMSFIVSGGATAPDKMFYERAPEGVSLLGGKSGEGDQATPAQGDPPPASPSSPDEKPQQPEIS